MGVGAPFSGENARYSVPVSYDKGGRNTNEEMLMDIENEGMDVLRRGGINIGETGSAGFEYDYASAGLFFEGEVDVEMDSSTEVGEGEQPDPVADADQSPSVSLDVFQGSTWHESPAENSDESDDEGEDLEHLRVEELPSSPSPFEQWMGPTPRELQANDLLDFEGPAEGAFAYPDLLDDLDEAQQMEGQADEGHLDDEDLQIRLMRRAERSN